MWYLIFTGNNKVRLFCLEDRGYNMAILSPKIIEVTHKTILSSAATEFQFCVEQYVEKNQFQARTS